MHHYPPPPNPLQPNAKYLSIYFAPGLDALRVHIYPLVTSNKFGIHPVHMQLPRLLASNGLSMVRLDQNTIKIYPTAEAAKYANAPVR